MKRLIATLFALVLTLSCVGCGAEPPAENGGSNAPDEKVLIGVEFFDWSMDLGKDIKNMIDYASEALGCTPMYGENKFDSEQCITDVENLFAAGCKAVIVCNTNEAQMLKLVQVAEKYNGKIFQFFRTLSDGDLKEQIMSSKAYGGQVHEDEYNTGYLVGKQMVSDGCKNVGLINFTVGDTTAEARQAGYVAAFKEANVNIVAETWEVTTGEVATQVTENYLASYPEIDGIAVVGGSGEALYAVQNTLAAQGKTADVKVSTIDFYGNMSADLESGALEAIAGGHWCDPFFAYMLAYNYCTGGISDSDLPVEVLNNMMYITSVEDSKNFDEWFCGDMPPYDADEIRSMTKAFNPDFTLADIQTTATALSIADVMERHAQ